MQDMVLRLASVHTTDSGWARTGSGSEGLEESCPTFRRCGDPMLCFSLSRLRRNGRHCVAAPFLGDWQCNCVRGVALFGHVFAPGW